MKSSVAAGIFYKNIYSMGSFERFDFNFHESILDTIIRTHIYFVIFSKVFLRFTVEYRFRLRTVQMFIARENSG